MCICIDSLLVPTSDDRPSNATRCHTHYFMHLYLIGYIVLICIYIYFPPADLLLLFYSIIYSLQMFIYTHVCVVHLVLEALCECHVSYLREV